jgi:hypothetical protein
MERTVSISNAGTVANAAVWEDEIGVDGLSDLTVDDVP